MCGIVGILNRSVEHAVDLHALVSMRDRLVHRGPDDAGHVIDRNVGIGMRRLSVIDVAGGQQPISNENGDCTILFNGEIYNYRNLRTELISRGHRFQTNTDTETIIHLYESSPDRFLERLNGMFGLAIYDSRSRTVTIARDRLGIKPLYYADTPEGLVFGSEIKALLAHPAVDLTPDPQAIDLFLNYKYIPAPWTAYRQIRKLPAGHVLHWQDGQYTISRYWSATDQPQRTESVEELAGELRERLGEAVRSQMVSDVPLGAFLSAGIDSSVIVALMAEHSQRPIKTFSIGFEESSYSELDHAKSVADHLGTEHHARVVRPDVQSLFDTVMDQFDEPFGDASAIPAYLVSQVAREHVTVALSGSGADELFAGYERYWAVGLGSAYRRIPSFARTAIEGLLDRMPSGHAKKSLVHRARSFVSASGIGGIEQHRQIVSAFRDAERAQIYRPGFLDEIGAFEDPLLASYNATEGPELNRLLHVDAGTLLAEDYLVKDDRMSMANSLELRVPFLDHGLVEFAASVPPGMKLSGLTTKHVLRQAVRDLLPASILKRPKHGFEMPIAKWLAEPLRPLVEDRLCSPTSSIGEVINTDRIRTLVDRHASGSENNARQIWALLSLDRWMDRVSATSPLTAVS